jgi:hypothetical protein
MDTKTKITFLAATAILATTMLAGTGARADVFSDSNQRGCVKIVTAIYGEYDSFYDWPSWCRVRKH